MRQPLGQSAAIVFTFLIHTLSIANDGLRVELQSPHHGSSVVDVRTVESVEEAFAQILHESENLDDAREIVIVDDLNTQKSWSREEILKNPKISYLPFQLTEKIAAAQTVAELDGRYEGLSDKVDAHYRRRVAEYKKLRLPITIVKATVVGVVNYFLYFEQFNHLVLPTLFWACWTAAMVGTFQWHAPEINQQYRKIADGFFGKFKSLKRFVVPEDGYGDASFYKIRDRIVKKLAVIGIGGFTVTTIFHTVGAAAFYAIGATVAPDNLLATINKLGLDFSDLTVSALVTGFGVNVLVSSLKELLVDVAPACFLSKVLKDRNLTPEAQRVGMAWGSAIIGGAATVLVLASQLLHSAGVQIAVYGLMASGATYLIYKYALKELFSVKFLEEIAKDFKSRGATKLLEIIETRRQRREAIAQRHVDPETRRAVVNTTPPPARAAGPTCLVFLLRPH